MKAAQKILYPTQVSIHCALAWGYPPLYALTTVRLASGKILTGKLEYQR